MEEQFFFDAMEAVGLRPIVIDEHTKFPTKERDTAMYIWYYDLGGGQYRYDFGCALNWYFACNESCWMVPGTVEE